MDILDTLDIFDCPRCHGTALLEEESGWCVYVSCLDCGCRTAEIPFKNEEERITAIKQAVSTRNCGKSVSPGISE